MKPRKLYMDSKKLEQPQDTYPFGKNGTSNANSNSRQNEKGFRLTSAIIPGEYCGTIETDSDPVIFSTDGPNSYIGQYNQETDQYDLKFTDADKTFKLGFDRNYFIIGEARRNFKNHIEIAFIDKLNPVRFMDLEEPPTNLDGFKIFPEYFEPTINNEMVNGGNLGMGAYFTAARYINSDGTETRYTTPTSPIFATANNYAAQPGGSTGKTLRITLTNLDMRYTQVQIIVIQRVKGVTTVRALPPVSVASIVTVSYSGSEGEDYTLEEALIPAAFYNNAGSITQLNDILYLADIQETQILNMQKYASLVKIKWQSQLIDNVEANDDLKSGKIRTFKHGEAYAFYISYQLNSSQWTDAFHIPGPAPVSDNLAIDPIATAQGFSAKKFQTGTVGMIGINTSDRTGYTGVWVNEETYPTGAKYSEFNSSDIGGEDLRGQPVRHHKMPTIAQCRASFYSNTPGYGTSGLDALGVIGDNIIIPPSLTGIVIGYEIFYAKRDYSSATIMSQGLNIHSARSGYTGGDQYFTGGNFHSRMLRSDFSSTDPNRELFLDSKALKINHPDLMVKRPAVTPTFLSAQFRIRAKPVMVTDTVDQLNTYIDYTAGFINNPAPIIKGIFDTGYILNNASKGIIKNNKSEDGFVANYGVGGSLDLNVAFQVHGGRDTEGDSFAAEFEEAFLLDLVVVKADVYRGFNSQDLVRTSVINYIDVTKPKVFSFNGDCFIGHYAYWSYGLVESVDRFYSNPGRVDGINGQEEDTYTDEFYLGTSGNKVMRRYLTESNMNLWQRYVDPGIGTSKFFPVNGKETLDALDRNRDNNTIAISQEANSVGDLLNGRKTYDFEQINIEKDPYKVIRSQQQSSEGKINSWKNYNPLDYYLTDRDKGPIINLQGFNDRLIIHHRNALFITKDKTTLQGDILSVTLGSGDIFDLKPQQGKPSRTGYAGTQHQLACKLTDAGYIFPDAERGIWFLLNESGLIELNEGIYNFLEDYLNIPEINPYIGNGICVGYDYRLKRILVTVKNVSIQSDPNYVPNYEPTAEFFAKLIPGQSIVFKDGRYQLYKGVNTSEYSCTVYPAPVINDASFTIDEDLPAGTIIGTPTFIGDPPLAFTILSGNISSAFSIDPTTATIVVSNQAALNYATTPTFNLIVKVSNTHGGSDTATITINLNAIDKPPVTQDYIVFVDENSPVDTALQQIVATDPKGLALTYTVQSQSVANAVKVSSTGLLSINTAEPFDYEVNPLITAVVRVSNGTLYTDSNILINVRDINEGPQAVDKTVTILDTQTGILIQYDQPTDPDGDVPVVTLVSQSIPNALQINTSARTLSLNPAHTLDPLNSPYVAVLRATDIGGATKDFVMTINVLYDPATLINDPFEFECEAGVIIPDFDFLVARYFWLPGAGSDLDTLTGIINSGIVGIDNNWVGWSQGFTVPDSPATPFETNAYLYSAGDNTGNGAESVLMNMKKFADENPSVPEIININMYAFWYGTRVTGDAQFELVAYKGGAMVKNGFEFENPTGTEVFRQTFTRNVVPNLQSSSPGTSTLLGTIKYNKTTQEAELIQD